MKFRCPECGEVFEPSNISELNKTIKCPACGAILNNPLYRSSINNPQNNSNSHNTEVEDYSEYVRKKESFGRKIKILSNVLFWINIVAAVVGFITFLSLDAEEFVGIAFGILAGGILAAFLIKYPLYALGQLVDNSDEIVKLLKEKNKTNDE